MFCPNCGGENRAEQNFCRGCGLRLDAIARNVVEQFPSEEYAALQRRKELFERGGVASLAVAGLVGVAFIITKVGLYKLILFGPEVLFWSAAAALIGFLLLSVFFFNFPKFFMNFEKIRPAPEKDPVLSTPTQKLIEDRPFEPVPSVTEETTDLLVSAKKNRQSN